MSIQTSRAHSIVDQALDYRAMRQDMISSNIANADTPFYRPRDISFQETLIAKKAEIFNEGRDKLALAQTDGAHIPLSSERNVSKATTFFRDGHMARNDGNSVDLDVETTEMSKNSVMFNALISGRKKSAGIFRAVLESSAKV
ncbi:MAG: flagellar basal body rod protein FlgB [Campylobacterota bacterium]|nr:flagellar basal body rod protein FlgB [Campylobacterota bacterium]